MIREYLKNHYDEITSKVKAITKNHELTYDLLNDCIISLLEKGSDYTTQLVLDDKVQHYLIKMCYIQFNSSTSPFYLKYRKESKKSNSIDGYDIEEKPIEVKEDKKKLADDIKLYIGKLPLYHREISRKHLIEGKSQREISRYYNINRIHIGRDINNVQKNIRLTFNRKDYESE